ncbi:hypothetical protein HMPREF3212_04886 [Citrobacter freundii]|uniref:Uncharacterized protein n=1 Tax=Citrobacter freundii TaxID=546 RepID=A0A133L5C6_CITFR|nr:hypothetical protein AB07_4670 [Citrobacter freundii]KWZ87161.1 hypothetical protein HMPREF3212_04886 [Citrobacter freundii]CDL36482.1 hypothetical protein [Citrobacter freundii]
MSAGKIKHQQKCVIPKPMTFLTFVKLLDESFVATHDTSATAIAFI